MTFIAPLLVEFPSPGTPGQIPAYRPTSRTKKHNAAIPLPVDGRMIMCPAPCSVVEGAVADGVAGLVTAGAAAEVGARSMCTEPFRPGLISQWWEGDRASDLPPLPLLRLRLRHLCGGGEDEAGEEIGVVEVVVGDEVQLGAGEDRAFHGRADQRATRRCRLEEEPVIADEGDHLVLDVDRVLAEHLAGRDAAHAAQLVEDEIEELPARSHTRLQRILDTRVKEPTYRRAPASAARSSSDTRAASLRAVHTSRSMTTNS